MERPCPDCGTVNYDDLADSCLNCGSALPSVDDSPMEDVSMGDVTPDTDWDGLDVESPFDMGGEEGDSVEGVEGEDSYESQDDYVEDGDHEAGGETGAAGDYEDGDYEAGGDEYVDEESEGSGDYAESSPEPAEEFGVEDDGLKASGGDKAARIALAKERLRLEKGERKKNKEKKKENQSKRAKRARLEEMERDLVAMEEEGKGSIFWKLNIISLAFFVFLAFFVLTDFFLNIFNISAGSHIALLNLVPTLDPSIGIPVLFVALIITTIDAFLHIWDKKSNILLSMVPTSMMILGLGIGAYEGYLTGMEIMIVYVLLMALLVMLAIDFICWLEYPSILEDVSRGGIDTYIEANEDKVQFETNLQQEYQDILAEEEEKLKLKEQEVEEIKQEIDTLNNQLSEEEEKLRLKDQEIASIQSELESRREDLMEEEEKIRMKEESIDSVVRAEVEKSYQEWVAEEEEKIKFKEEELAHTRADLDIQKRMMEEVRERLRMKEYELSSVRSELESQLRERLEEEEMLRIKETAARMGEKEKQKRTLFPFTAMVGQEQMKKGLILNAIYSGIGGVLIRGQKGTGKSVSVRGLAEILPNINVTGCKFNCDPDDEATLCYECRRRAEMGKLETFTRPVQVVDLPLNITEDRLVGSIDIEKILSEGTKSFEPGLLAEAHRGILYVDEINLLDDYIVDILLDAASSGQVVIEREGVSVNHPSSFIIVGSMNPEEGELRPQILDRIALQTEVVGIHVIEGRMDIVRRRDSFTNDPQTFRATFEPEQENLRKRIEEARRRLPNVKTPERMLTLIARLCLDFNVDGHRADIIIERAARANAAFEGRLEVTSEDVAVAAEMSLPHRMRRRPYAEERFDTDVLAKWIKKIDTEV